MKTTAGNWNYQQLSPCDYSVYSDEGDGNDIAIVREKGGEGEANVKVITASKQMLEMLMFINDATNRNIPIEKGSSLHMDIEYLIHEITE